jgi:hypothetical protein
MIMLVEQKIVLDNKFILHRYIYIKRTNSYQSSIMDGTISNLTLVYTHQNHKVAN